MASKEPFFNWKTKLGMFIFLLLICFLLFDLGSLYGLNLSLQHTDIDPYQLRDLKISLSNTFMLKILQLFIVSGAVYGIVYWILIPYNDLIKKIKTFAKQYPELKPLVKGQQNELGQVNKVVDVIASSWDKEQASNEETDK